MSSYTSTIQFSVPCEKFKAIEEIEKAIYILEFGINDGFEGFSKKAGESKTIQDLCISLRELLGKITEKVIHDDFSKHELYTSLPENTIDLESNDIEFDDSICKENDTIIIYSSFFCRSKFVEGIVNRAKKEKNNKLNIQNISINDYDEHYIDMSWF